MRWTERVPSRRKLADAAAFLYVLAIAVMSTRYLTPLIDDTYITLRHSLNLARGNGLVYNPGEHLLGATSPVYAALLAALVPIFANPVAAAIYLWPFTLAVAGFLAYRLSGRGLIGLAGATVLCMDPGLYPIVGMETTFYVAILFAILALFEAGRLEVTAFLLGLLPMVRPDGVFLVAAAVAVWLWESRGSFDRRFLRRHARLGALLLLPLVVWCVAATIYYGHPLPNSFVAKYYQGKVAWWWSDRMTFRFRLVEQLATLRSRLLIAGASLGALLALFRKDRVLRAGCLFIVLYLTAYVVSRVPAYANYFFPPFSMMTLVGFRGLGLLFELLTPRIGLALGKAWLVRARAGLTFAAALAALVVVARSSELQLLSRIGPPDPEMAYVQIGRYLKQHAPRSASVGAMEIGIIGYLSESKIVDFAGLVSRGVMPAVAAGKRRYALDVFRPDYVVVRYPIPLTLEGGLTEGELTANYQLLFGAGGVGVFRAVRPHAGENWDVSADADRLNAYPGTVFIAKQRIDQGELDALDRAVAPHGSLVVRSLFRNERDVGFKRYAYASFREGHLESIEPLMDDSEVEALSHLPRFEFDSPSESFDGWKDAETHRLGGSMLHVITSDPDSYLAVPIAPFAPWLAGSASIRMRVTHVTDCPTAHADGALFWVTETDRSWGARDKMVPFPVVTDGAWHEIRLDLSDHAAWSGSGVIRELRFDPLHCIATMDIDYFRIE